MNFRIPIYVEETRADGAPTSSFSVRPLFVAEPARQGDKLNRTLTRLANDVRQALQGHAAESDHRALADWTFAPTLDEQWLETRLELKGGHLACRALVVSFEAFDRRIVFMPAVSGLVFEVRRGQDVKWRAVEMLTRHFRDLEREAGTPLREDAAPVAKKAWLTVLDLSVTIAAETKPPQKPSFFSLLGGDAPVSGAQALERVGRCLSFLYPDDLDRAVLRDREVEELHTLLTAKDRRPVLLVGPRQAGKTTVMHEVVWRLVHARKRKFAAKGNVWLLAPARLISGMSYVGQWENRLLAILKEAQERDHILYFDDLPGLFLAGQTSGSNLSAADVLKPRLEKRECRVVGEITPEALRVLRERDRSFADLFHVVPVHEPPERESTRILIAVQRQLEEQHQARFSLEAVPIVCDVQRRYASDRAFPGKAAGFLRQLAVKFRGRDVSRADVLQEFQAKTGLLLPLLDARTRLRREQVRQHLRAEIVGQATAVEAMSDVVTLAAARLNDPTRPLASLLFLGPTGVGKTQCAKALAKYLFGDASRLVRFDMNEFLSADSAARLVGTMTEPEGLLTSAVRRQPFCVLLLDEIEKAHPDVLDLLLAVLGEGRLTDAHGRTANFSNAIIILTSNLGAREARARLGFHPYGEDQPSQLTANAEGSRSSSLPPRDDASAIYLEAAEKFFRPEFFNRLDRVVPFTLLSRKEIEGIANHVIADVFNRDGLRQRQCSLQVHPAAMSLLIEQGHHPQLGARALKRVVERQLAQPVALHLSELPPGTPTVVSLFARDGNIAAQVAPLRSAEPQGVSRLSISRVAPDEIFSRVEAALARLEARIEPWAPRGRVLLNELSREQARYFAVTEQLKTVDLLLQRAANAGQRRGSGPGAPRVGRPRVPSARQLVRFTGSALYKQQLAAEQFRASLRDLETTPHGRDAGAQLTDCLHELALAHAMAEADDTESRALLCLTMHDPSRAWAISAKLRASMREMFGKLWGFTVSELEAPKPSRELGRDRVAVLLVEGPGAQRIAGVEAGTHLFLPQAGNMILSSAVVLPLSADEDPGARLAALGGTGAAPSFGPIIRVTEESGRTVDPRSNFAVDGEPNAEELRTFVLSQLPWPAEFEELAERRED